MPLSAAARIKYAMSKVKGGVKKVKAFQDRHAAKLKKKVEGGYRP